MYLFLLVGSLTLSLQFFCNALSRTLAYFRLAFTFFIFIVTNVNFSLDKSCSHIIWIAPYKESQLSDSWFICSLGYYHVFVNLNIGCVLLCFFDSYAELSVDFCSIVLCVCFSAIGLKYQPFFAFIIRLFLLPVE